MEKTRYVNGLTDSESGFISNPDNFHLAMSGENGYPYIQHRGWSEKVYKSN